MEADRTLENELWDDEAAEVGKIKHVGCGGRVYWIYGDEFRCLKCCNRVEPEEMDHGPVPVKATHKKQARS